MARDDTVRIARTASDASDALWLKEVLIILFKRFSSFSRSQPDRMRGGVNKDANNSNLPGRGEGENTACDKTDDRDNGERYVDTHQLKYGLWVRIELSSHGDESILGGVEKP